VSQGRSGNRLPRETTPRFILAVLALTIAAVAVAESLWYSVYLEHANYVLTDLCGREDPSLCDAEERSRIVWTIMFAPLVVAAALIVAAGSSAYRRSRLKSLPAFPAATDVNTTAATDIGTTPVPLVWRPARPAATARADGLVRRYIEVGPNWLPQLMSDRGSATAVLRHEYAHHRNRDVIGARITIAMSIVVALLATLLLILSFSVDHLGTTASVVARSVGVLLVAALAQSSVLRAREFDADSWSATHGFVELRRALSAGVDKASGRSWRAALAHHPSPKQRIDFIEKPALLYHPRVSDALLVGLTASIGAPVIARLLQQWSNVGSNVRLFAPSIAWAGVGVVVGCWLVVTLWNETIVSGGRHQSPLPFAGVLAIALLVGNVLFHEGFIASTFPVPHHVVDVTSSLMLALTLPIGVLWIAQLLDAIARAVPGASLFRGLPALSSVISLLMLASLMAAIAFVHEYALLMASNMELATRRAADVNSPFTIVDMAQTWSTDWTGALLPVSALAGAVTLIVGRPIKPRRYVFVLGAPLLGAGLATLIFWLLRDQFDLVTRARTSWYAAGRSVLFIPLTFGTVLAVAIVLAVLQVDRSRVVLAGGLAVIGSLVAALLVDFAVMPRSGYFWSFFLQIVLFAVFLSMLFAAIAGERPFSWRGEFLAAVAGTVLILAVSVSCVRASTAVPSVEMDRSHYATAMAPEFTTDGHTMNGPLVQARAVCLGSIDSSTPHLLGAQADRYRGPEIYPATADLRQLHASLLDTLRVCEEGSRQAISEGRGLLTQDQAGRFNAGMEQYFESFAAKVLTSG